MPSIKGPSSLSAYRNFPGLQQFDFSPLVLGRFPRSDFARAPMEGNAR